MRVLSLFFLFFALSSCHRTDPSAESFVAIQIQDRNGLTETISSPDRLEIYQSTDFLDSQPYKKVLRVYRKEGKNRSKITSYHPNGSIWQFLEAEEMRAHGTFNEWFPNGQLKISATVIGGTADLSPGAQQDWLFDGLSQVWDDQGNLLAKISYEKGALQGESTYFFPSGQIESHLVFFKDKIEGEVTEFFSEGSLKAKTVYKNGLKEGESLGFFPGAKTCWVEQYSEGLLVKGSYYNAAGELISEVKNGGGFQAVFEGTQLAFTREFKHGVSEGKVQKYGRFGEVKGFYFVKGGRKEGEQVEFYPASENQGRSQPKLLITWHEDLIHGKVKTWHANGKLQSERDFCRNQKSGPSIAWYPDGSLMLIEEYEEGKLSKGQYYKMGQKDPISTVFNGSGTASLFDETGVLTRKVTYVKGAPVDPET